MRLCARALPWLLAAGAALIYLPALSASFQFDDWQVVLDDPRVASLSAWWQSMPGMRALLKLSYAINHELGEAVQGFRTVNILLHALNTALVFVLVRRLVERLGSSDQGITVALTVALLFGLHPVQTESVTYIAARSNLIATLFSVAALLAWLRGREHGARRWWPVAAVCYLCALAGKETAAVLPLAMLLCLAAERRLQARETLFPLSLLALCVGLFVLAWPHFPYDYLVRTSLETRAPLSNLLAQAQAITWLGGQLLLWGRLNADPMLQPAATLSLPLITQVMAWAALLATGVWSLRRQPALGFGILWFFLWLAPTNSLLARLDLANDRQLYLALVGPAWCAGHLVAKLRGRAALALPLLALVLAWGTVQRNRVYATELTFWQDVVEKSPHNTRAWNNLGFAAALACDRAGATHAFEEAARRDPADTRPSINLALLEQGELPGMADRCR